MMVAATYKDTPVFGLRDADHFERSCSCNGCLEGAVVAVLVVGYRGHGGYGGNTQLWRMCRNCTIRLKSAVSGYTLPERRVAK